MRYVHQLPTNEVIAWLIEDKNSGAEVGGPKWMKINTWGERSCPEIVKTKDAYQATWFGKKEDAEAFMAWYDYEKSTKMREQCVVTEHSFQVLP